MRIFYIILILLLSLVNRTNAQYNFEVGCNFGGTGYLGEIGGTGIEGKGFLGDIIIKETNITAGINGKFKITPKLYMNTGINYIKITGDDINTGEGPRYWRNLRFANNIYELNTRVEYSLYKINDLGGRGMYNTSLDFYAFIGISGFYHNPIGSLNPEAPLKEWIKLKPLQTEGVSYSNLGISTPYGGGFIITTGTFYKFGMYFNYMKNYTDYLDDISTFYADPSTLSNQAAELANQYNGPEESAASFGAGQIRGNPSNFDDIFMVNFSFSKVIASKNNIYYADYLMKYKIPKKLRRKSNYSGRQRKNTYQFKKFKKKKSSRTMKATF
ncbi:MAG: hypothetical protein CL837_07860 [Crocinitomicaceae bacterium]|nr:hypothetical protein [Crocinitomicaceae bacterium]